MDPNQILSNGKLIDQKYKVIKIRGQGTFGVVYQCQNILKGGKVAVKHCQVQVQLEGLSPAILRQISVLKELQHQNIVKLIQPIFRIPNLFLVFQLVDMDLRTHIESHANGPLPPQQVKSITHQLLKAVHLCHSRKILHRDIKPGNILINKQGLIKLADFGLARPYNNPTIQLSEEVVTLWYRAPQILKGCQHYGLPIDIWSVGCILAELAFGQPLFPGTTDLDQLDNIIQVMGTPTKQSWPKFFLNMEVESQKEYTDAEFTLKLSQSSLDSNGRDLLRSMLSMNPQSRITSYQALAHPYFN